MRIRLAAVASDGGRGGRPGLQRECDRADGHPEPALGAHLETLRVGYRHHGVYVGGGVVVHYSGFLRSGRTGIVEETTLAGFAVGRPIRVVEHQEPGYSAQEVIDRARSRVGERQYRVFDNNCEHFCNWCITGFSHSLQAQRPAARLIQALCNLLDLRARVGAMLARLAATLNAGPPTALLAGSAERFGRAR